MALGAGTRLGPYEVLGVIGAGGMGEVYRARDTALHRDVAIKVLPEAMAEHPRRLLRFEREARALGALNHPNIATVYGIEDPPPGSGHGRALVMEFVEGEDLSWRLARGPLPRAEALSIARQVAEALAAAHEAGIVHRDLKPANIKVRGEGTVKVLDFGLATAATEDTDSGPGSGSGSGSGPDHLPHTVTLAGDMTRDGDVVGTAAYMAPEQALGKPVDRRADIWAFGVVLFEMLAGQRPFAAGDAAETIAGTLTEEPAWEVLPPDTPSSIRRLLARCLAKDRRQRLHDIADARLEIDEAVAPRVPDHEGAVGESRAAVRRWRSVALVALCLPVVVALAAWGRSPATPTVTHARLDVNPAAEVNAGGIHPSVVLPAAGARTALAWLPDGRTLAFLGVSGGVRQVYLHDLATDAARPLTGTEGARVFAVSPDGSEVAFWAEDAIRKVGIGGGPPAKLCDATSVNGLAWGDNRLVFVEAPVLFEVSTAGGERRQITHPPQLVRHASPFVLPGGKTLLYTEYEKQWTSGDERVMIQSLAPGAQPRVLLPRAADARYLATGHLAFLRQGTLFVVQFDPRTLEVSGEPVAVLKDVAQAVVAWDSEDLTLAGHYAISPQGTLAYVSSPRTVYPDRELVAIDRRGRIASIGAPTLGYRNHVERSPDGSRLAVSVQTANDIRVFAYDLRRHNLSRLADALRGEVIVASWSQDGEVAVQLVDGGKITTAVVHPDDARPTRIVPESAGFWASSWSRDGRLAGMRDGHLWISSPGVDEGRPVEWVTTRTTETQPTWSPDGRWLAYTSDATGRLEVYVRPFRGPGGAVAVSTNGGSSPAWNPEGQELFYVEPGPDRGRMMAVRMTSPAQPGAPAVLFSFAPDELILGAAVLTPYAVAPDGQRFFAVRQPRRGAPPVTDIRLVVNWFEELSATIPGFGSRRPPWLAF